MDGVDNGPRRCGFGMPGCRWGRRGMGGRGIGGEMTRAGRMLAQGDLKLIALALIAEQPRHGYDIIKVIEEKTAGWYAPSPGVVYPTLTYLEETGHVVAQPEGAKKLYVATDEGRDHLAANRALAEAVFDRLASFGEMMRQQNGEGAPEAGDLPPLLRAALDNLREVAIRQIAKDPDNEAELVAILARAAGELRKTQARGDSRQLDDAFDQVPNQQSGTASLFRRRK
ncbi:PadR family transcriptional regulator [Rhodopseudomonas sp. WA056]|uniref:PadR family transcriptional regulator n=1 Tax=Rhodopseudomonas sp. WA056 TaxID=2269367 RepID=UPI000641AF05|nr:MULTISPECIES: PadR family transcriptional regulator [Rhodopseudomonas]NEW88906.1 PadR family transcriptional regulator [Rhodopseudomonas sp. WA056]QDL96026.1 PadR family transcriptional regulator [Rhodopseudomonas palustris]